MTTTTDNPEGQAVRFGRYVLALLCLTGLLYVLPFLLIRAPRFERWDSTAFGSSLEWGYTLEHADADVLVFGDSAALYGVDPMRVFAALGLKTVNLPNVLTSLLVMDDRSLKHYLAHNKPPRLIVFYFTPWDLDYRRTEASFPTNEGDLMMLRHGSAGDIGGYYRDHVTEYLVFPFKFYRWLDLGSVRRLVHPPAGPAPMEMSSGHMDVGINELLAPGCRLPDRLVAAARSMETVRQMAARYQSEHTRVLVYVAPIPGCAGASAVAGEDFHTLPAAPPLILAPEHFVADGNYAHPDKSSVDLATDLLIEAVRHDAAGRGVRR